MTDIADRYDRLTADFAAANRVVSDHLHDPDAAAASFEGAVFGHMTFAEGIDRFVSFDLLIHRWDLAPGRGLRRHAARRRGRPRLGGRDRLRRRDAGAERLRARGRRPRGADDQTRLLAFLGRTV